MHELEKSFDNHPLLAIAQKSKNDRFRELIQHQNDERNTDNSPIRRA
jgi:hypothetical protein